MLAETINHARRILEIASSREIGLRLTGSIAIVMRCPMRYAQRDQQGWKPADIDFVCARQDAPRLQALFNDLDFENDKRLLMATEGTRWTLCSEDSPQAIDVFFDQLEFCHKIDLRGRIGIDPETLTLADLLLTKLQYVAPRQADLDDLIALIEAYPLGPTDTDMINLSRISSVLASSWGFYYTACLNSQRLSSHLVSTDGINASCVETVCERLKTIREATDNKPKGILWLIRALIGPRLKWYNDVEEAEVF